MASRRENLKIVPKLLVLASCTTTRIHCKGHDLEMVPKLLVSAPRHPANTERVVTFGVATSHTKRNGAEATCFNATIWPRAATARQPREGRHLRHEMVPKLLVFALRCTCDQGQHREGRHLYIETVPTRAGSTWVAGR